MSSLKPKGKKPIISIVGTTGVGKSQFSIDLAKRINGEIINADSMQVYKGLDIITNKHPVLEREGVPHHVIDYVDWTDEYFIHKFTQDANAAIEDIHERDKVPIVVGGTHYYLQSLLFKNKTMDSTKVKERELTAEELSILDGPVDELFKTLKDVDPIIAEKFHPQDQRKLRRALEIWYTTGQKPSTIYHEQKIGELEESSLKYNTIVFWLYSEMTELSKRLDLRVDTMMQTGAVDEINNLYSSYKARGADCTSGIYQVIGFKEFLPWLEESSSSSSSSSLADKQGAVAKEERMKTKAFDSGVDRMKIRTRQYAKYQVKWIQKTLSLELEKEAKFNYENGGQLCILDATDLSQWDTSVRNRGLEIALKFLKGNNDFEMVPKKLQDLLANDAKHAKSNKNLNANTKWKHFTCELCTAKNGQPLVAVGEELWIEHLNSRRHRRAIAASKKRGHIEEMIKLKEAKRRDLELE